MQHLCNLEAKESGLECTCISNDDFTVLVSRGSRCRWVNMCTVWLSHSKSLSELSNRSASNFALSLNIPLWKLLAWFRRLQLWAAGDWQPHHDNVPTHGTCLMQSFFVKHQITQVTQPNTAQIWHPQLLVFPKTKITFEREGISDSRWDSGKYNGATDGDWENCVRSQGAYIEGDWGIIVLCTMLLVSCIFFNKCLYFSYYMAGYLLDKPRWCWLI